ncbi:hypothetical protein P5673_007711 [Acropora cervicornis]|uniref:Uncharacterized protein n=1 Tax=Acropora cervicornis TaxID=6130 RepID=A0AAD9QUX3_ACRCE|nr:hypothetical protein P5673_007711 [Acropora cervicornis]
MSIKLFFAIGTISKWKALTVSLPVDATPNLFLSCVLINNEYLRKRRESFHNFTILRNYPFLRLFNGFAYDPFIF